MGINIDKVEAKKTVTLDVEVTFMDGSTGSFAAEYKRVSTDRVEDLVEQNNRDVLDEVLVGVTGIGRTDPENSSRTVELPADEQLAFVHGSPEASQAAVLHFFSAMRQAGPDAKTSKRRR